MDDYTKQNVRKEIMTLIFPQITIRCRNLC